MTEYIRTKLSMVKNMTNDDFVIFNEDDKTLSTHFKNFIFQAIPYGLKGNNKFFSIKNSILYDKNNEPFLKSEKFVLKANIIYLILLLQQ